MVVDKSTVYFCKTQKSV